MQVSDLDKLIARGKVSYRDLVRARLDNDESVSYLFYFDRIRVTDLAKFYKLPTMTAYRRFTKQDIFTQSYNSVIHSKGKYVSHRVSPNSVFSCEEDYIAFLRWLDSSKGHLVYDVHDSEVAVRLGISVRQVRRLKRNGALRGTRRGYTSRASLELLSVN